MRLNERSFLRALIAAAVSLLVLGLSAQIVDEDALRKIPLPARDGSIACITPLPDGRTLAVGISKGGGVLLVDTNTWSVVRTIPVEGFHDGARLKVSEDGRYLHLAEQSRWTNDAAKDMKGTQAVLDLAKGEVVLSVSGARDGVMSRDGRTLLTLEGASVLKRSIPSGEVVQTLSVDGATNAIALSPDGTLLAVSHRATEELVANVPSVRNDRKGIKAAVKFRQMVGLYRLPEGALWRTVNEVYDIVRAMEFSPDGKRVLVYSTTDIRVPGQATSFNTSMNLNMVDRPGHVEQIDATTGEPLRVGFMSLMNEPFLAVSPVANTIALSTSEGHNKRKIMLFDTESGDTRLMIDLAQKHRYDVGETEQHDGRVAYCWLADGRLMLSQGDNLALWKP